MLPRCLALGGKPDIDLIPLFLLLLVQQLAAAADASIDGIPQFERRLEILHKLNRLREIGADGLLPDHCFGFRRVGICMCEEFVQVLSYCDAKGAIVG